MDDGLFRKVCLIFKRPISTQTNAPYWKIIDELHYFPRERCLGIYANEIALQHERDVLGIVLTQTREDGHRQR